MKMPICRFDMGASLLGSRPHKERGVGTKVRAIILAMLASCGFIAETSIAQSVAAGDPENSTQLKEIIVTAQKREENLQNVPIAVAVVTGSTLDKLGVDSTTDLSIAVPGLYMTDTFGRLTMSLRGIGTNAVGPGIENPIALYMDGVYYASSTASLLSLNSISQLEVLKGPQGTLFGRNATGGLIQVTTSEPTQTPAGYINVSQGNYDTSILNALVSGGVANNLAADFAVYAQHQGEGWGKDFATGQHAYDVDHNVSVRSKWVYTPSSETKLTFIADYEDVLDRLLLLAVKPGSVSAFVPGVLQPDLGYNVNDNYLPDHTIKSGGASLRWDQKFEDFAFSSITAYRNASTAYGGDLDASPANLVSFIFEQYDKQLTQELQLSSRGSGPVKWTTGLYYYYGTAGYDPGKIPLEYIGIEEDYPSANERINSAAAYLQGSYEFADDTSLTLGGRFTHERRDEFNTTISVFAAGADPSTGAITQVPPASISSDKFTYRASLDHRFSSEVLAYASVSTGFKAGGFDLSSPGTPGFRPETLTAYETGLKTDLFDKRIRVNVAAFYSTYKDIQVTQYTKISIETVNGAGARSYGVDADITAVLAPGLVLTGGFTLDHPTFTSFPGCGDAAPIGGVALVAGNCTGNQLVFAPQATASSALDYTFDVGSGSLDLNGNVYYNSGYYTDLANVIHQERFAKVGAFAKWAFGSHYSIGAYGANLTNKRTITYGDSQGIGTQLVNYMAPRTYGVTFGYKF
jgi:iron complex outermembrane receptor protein